MTSDPDLAPMSVPVPAAGTGICSDAGTDGNPWCLLSAVRLMSVQNCIELSPSVLRLANETICPTAVISNHARSKFARCILALLTEGGTGLGNRRWALRFRRATGDEQRNDEWPVS